MPDTLPAITSLEASATLAEATARIAALEKELALAREQDSSAAQQLAFYETILNSLPAEIGVVDAELRFQYLNPAAMADPAARQAAQGKTLAELAPQPGCPPEFTPRHRALFDRACAGQVVEWTEVVAKPSGPRHFLRRMQPVFGPDGALAWFIGYGLDVTDREQARQALADEQAFTRQVLDTTPSMIFVRDRAGKFLFQNRAIQELHAAAQLSGDADSRHRTRDEELARFAEIDAQVMDGNREIVVEDCFTLADGSVRWYHSTKRPLHRPDGTVHVLGVSTDITELKAAQLAAEAAATARQNFLANMSHEIRTPLNGVLGMAAHLTKTPLDPRQQQLIDIMQRSGQHLLSVVNDVLDMAKISSGKLEMEQVAFNLCDSVSAALQPLALQATEKGLVFEGTSLRTSCPQPWVIGDAHRLNQIIINLVSNALKFTERGIINASSELVAETADTLTVRFSVADTGIGIAPSQQERIFESFTQAYADTSRQFGGTGLGLSIARALVAQLGGTLTMTSAVGRGTTFVFTVTLPKAPVPAQARGFTAAYDTGRLAGVRVLMVEDNEINRAVAQMTLAPWGVVLEEAVDGPAGLACLEANYYDIVLMDIQMPGMSGVDVTRNLRQLPDARRANTPVIALTANAFRSDVEQYLAAGMNDYLAKPFDEEVLYHKMEALLAAPAEPLYDLARLRQQSQGHAAFVGQILRSFQANMPLSLAQLRAAAAARHWAQVAEIAHHIKPNLLALGVVAAAAPLETLGRAHPKATPATLPAPEVLAEAVDQLAAVVGRVLAAMPAELAALEAAA
ncbi:PAS domain-containing protein [Microvirga sp. STS02]|uniref:PAS domain-containing protein n=1 Tax=Hymenobacter negativus TaxID=2795026 RepID=UPI0018DD5ABD|nr:MULTISPECIES: PAS domain-containing protein [Bacteria]MBH8570661.1 PAS domain-containing protein [Hymenobacter negativus]MBR7210399.1 PAS domain-containing protein [Microvirga sp. STS02]